MGLLLKIAFAVLHCLVYTNFVDRSRKMQLMYDVTGLAVVRAVCLLEIHADKERVFYQNSLTRNLTRNYPSYVKQRTTLDASAFCDPSVNEGCL